jgi:hypothetical protein
VKAWLHFGGMIPTCAPVRVLAKGPKRARVKLVHRLRWNRKWYRAGSTRYVPTWALAGVPGRGYMVGVGRGHYVNPRSVEARAVVKRWSEAAK